ncbi:MAG: sensor histidine kinase [Leucobacter sp.]
MTEFTGAAWARPRPSSAGFRGDLALALGLAFAAALTSLLYARTGIYEEPAAPGVWVAGLALCTLPLAWRRRYPVPVAVVVAVGFFVCGQFEVPETLIINICLFTALYTVGAWESNRPVALWTQLGISVAMIGWLVLMLIVASSEEDAFPSISRSGIFSAYATFAVLQIITNLLYFGGAYFFGERSWRAARTQAQLEAQGRELELERRTSAEQAVALDRLAIARELHDVVAHHVSVMGIQAAAARRSIDASPERAVAALEVVEESAHSAITELRGLLDTLRTPDAESGATTVGIAHLPALVAESQGVGVPTTLVVVGETRPLPMLVDVALYRVVQEALTNVRKHAGRGVQAVVRLRFEREAVEVEVSDDGVRHRVTGGGSNGEGSRLGLRGMRERIGAVGGELFAGRREPAPDAGITGGFMVRARVPVAPAHTVHSADIGNPVETVNAPAERDRA